MYYNNSKTNKSDDGGYINEKLNESSEIKKNTKRWYFEYKDKNEK